MKTIAFILIALVAALHAGILVLEMFYWDHPIGRDIFSMTEAESATTAVLAANQGLYNGFLAAGLAWSLISRKKDVAIFFLLCVVIAGIFGSATAKFTILYTQAAPAALALLATLLWWKKSLALNF